MLTIGYIGNGKSTNRYHLPFSLNRADLKVKTIYTRNPDKGEWKKSLTCSIQIILNL